MIITDRPTVTATYTNPATGTQSDLEGESVKEIHEEMARHSLSGSTVRVVDDQGSTRGWASSEGWSQ